jgi:hypothetical protein
MSPDKKSMDAHGIFPGGPAEGQSGSIIDRHPADHGMLVSLGVAVVVA